MSTSPPYEYNVAADMAYIEKWFNPECRESFSHGYDPLDVFPWRDNDITVCTYPRSGTHIAWHIVRMVVQNSPEAKLSDDPMEESTFNLPHFRPNQQDQHARRIFSAHLVPHDITDNVIFTGNRKFIYVIRNPKDVAVSTYKVLQDCGNVLNIMPEWDEFVRDFAMNGLQVLGRTWFQSVRAWEEFTKRHPNAPILVVTFEDIIMNRRKEIYRIADFLDVELSEESTHAICEKSMFKKMKDAPISELLACLGPRGKPNYYRKGVVGDWRTHFTVAQNELFDIQTKQLMEGCEWHMVYEI